MATSTFIFGHSLYFFGHQLPSPLIQITAHFSTHFCPSFSCMQLPTLSFVSLLSSENHRILDLEGLSRAHSSFYLADYKCSRLMTTQGLKWCFTEPGSCEDQFSASCFALIGICFWEKVLRIENYYSLGM